MNLKEFDEERKRDNKRSFEIGDQVEIDLKDNSFYMNNDYDYPIQENVELNTFLGTIMEIVEVSNRTLYTVKVPINNGIEIATFYEIELKKVYR